MLSYFKDYWSYAFNQTRENFKTNLEVLLPKSSLNEKHTMEKNQKEVLKYYYGILRFFGMRSHNFAFTDRAKVSGLFIER